MADMEHFEPHWLLLATFSMPLGTLFFASGQVADPNSIDWGMGIGISIAVGVVLSFTTGYLLWRRAQPNAFNAITCGANGKVCGNGAGEAGGGGSRRRGGLSLVWCWVLSWDTCRDGRHSPRHSTP